MAEAAMPRNRTGLATGIVLVIGAGLASRKFPAMMPTLLGKYPGDALWAVMILLLIAFLKPGIRPALLAVLALAVCFVVEFSQLYHAPWIDAIRNTTPGHLVLGSGFLWQDLVAYTAGIALGCSVDTVLWQRRKRRKKPRIL